MAEALLFVVMGLTALAGAVTVVMARNPIYSAMGLLATLLSVAVLYVAQLAHLVAAVQVIVYAGAVLTLFLFVIMLIGVDKEENRKEPLPFQRWVVGGLALVIILFAASVALFADFEWVPVATETIPGSTNGTIEAVAVLPKPPYCTTSTPEYVSGVVLTVIFASQMVGLQWFSGSATTAADDGPTIYNFALPVLTIAIYGMGYIARMTRASMAEVMTQQYIRTARLKGLSFHAIVLKHALRNALIAPFTVIMLQFPWLLTGVVIVETLFNYRGFGWLLIEGAANNDIDLLLACSIVAVVIVLVTQLVSDIGYVYLNPRIRVTA